MNWAQTNEYVQTAAGLVAIVGIFLLGYEVRQSNNNALAERTSSVLATYAEANGDSISSGVSAAKAIAMESPQDLTLQQKVDLDWHYWKTIRTWQHASASLWNLDIDRSFWDEKVRALIIHQAPSEFGGTYARAWLEVNKPGIPDFVIDPILTSLEGTPVNADRLYFERIDAAAGFRE